MGYLTESAAMVKNAEEVLNTIYSTNFTQFLQGLGLPVLGTWYNFNSTMSKTDNGTEDIDHLLGKESPVRYNKILNMPVYGLPKDMNPEITAGEGGLLDMNMELEVVVLPNAFKPQPYDYFLYKFGGEFNTRSVLFRINNVNVTTIKSNSYYKCNMAMIEIDDDSQLSMLETQVVKTYRTDLDRIGTNDNCFIEDTVFEKIHAVEALADDLLDQYIQLFYSARYNCFIYKPSLDDNMEYDPYLSNFIIHSHMAETKKNSITTVVFDQDADFPALYNMTFFRAIETRKTRDIPKNLYVQPYPFTRKTVNPFAYWGEDYAYKLVVNRDDENLGIGSKYQDYSFYSNIMLNDEKGLNPIEASIVRYFNSQEDIKLFNDDDLTWLEDNVLTYKQYHYMLIPITILLLRKYATALRDSY